jgi:hypothetical protein
LPRLGGAGSATTGSRARGPAVAATLVAVLETTAMMLTPPGAATVALWLDAWARGAASADDLLEALAGAAPDTPQVLAAGQGAEPLAALLRQARGAGVTAAWPVLPRAGRVAGWPRDVPGHPVPAVLLGRGGPAPAALALLRAAPPGWLLSATAVPVDPLLAEALTARAATRRFTELVDGAARELARLGLERRSPHSPVRRWAEALADLPAALDPALAALLQRTGMVLDALELALADDGAAVTAAEARARTTSLHRLHADLVDLVAAASVGAAASPGPRP